MGQNGGGDAAGAGFICLPLARLLVAHTSTWNKYIRTSWMQCVGGRGSG